MPSRRAFLLQSLLPATALLHHPALRAQILASQAATHPNLAAIDHDRILAAAARALTLPPQPITNLPAPRSPASPNDFYSEPTNPEPDQAPAPDAPGLPAPSTRRDAPPNPAAFTAHRDALFTLSQIVAALAAATTLTRTSDPGQAARYVTHAALHLRAWFVSPATRMNAALPYAGRLPESATGSYQGILDTVPLAEIAQAIPFLIPEYSGASALSSPDIAALKAWFAGYLHWLTDPEPSTPLVILARDQKNHYGTSWLLQSAAFAALTTHLSGKEDPAQATLRHHYKTVTIRAQIRADGTFPHELTGPNPYRNSLFNLDMLAAVCDLLSTPFDNVWNHQLQDGPGMRVAIARHVPFMQNRGAWPYLADRTHFTDLPTRRPALLLAGRAYQRPEYIDLFRSLTPIATLPASPIPEIARTIPLHQPILWVTRPTA